MPDDPPSPPPDNPPDPKGQLKFRDDVVPWLSSRKEEDMADPAEDLLKWEEPDERPRSRGRSPAFVGVVIIALALCVLVVVIVRKGGWGGEAEELTSSRPEIFEENKRKLAWIAMEGFLAAETVDDKLAFVAWPEKVAPRMREYYARTPDEAPDLAGFQFLSSSPRFETDETYFLAISAEGDATRLWVLLDTETSLKIDWECLVAYSPMSIAQFIASPPSESVEMRVSAQRSDYFNYEFADSTRYAAFELRGLESGAPPIYGYAKLGSEVERELTVLTGGSRIAPVRLSLKPPATPGRRSCEIERVVKPHWSGE